MKKAPLLTRKQTAEKLNMSPRTLAKWAMTDKNLPVVRIGTRAVRYRQEDVEEFLRQNTRGQLNKESDKESNQDME
jgi:excisionase family DNA binding protein